MFAALKENEQRKAQEERARRRKEQQEAMAEKRKEGKDCSWLLRGANVDDFDGDDDDGCDK